jgi:peptidoglycan hydrolase-like protein with peptidoglycan-binding domain
VLSWPELKQGARNPNVTAAQYLLQARGYKLGADGVFGPMTRASVTAFEKSLNLAVNGTIARPEWVAMLASVRYGSHGVVVRALQVLLRKNAIQVTVDGMFGQLTRAAVERAQRLNALPVNGVVERSTWKALVCRGNAE